MDSETSATASLDAVVEDSLARLDLPRMVKVLTGAGFWTTAADEEIGLQSIVFSDGVAGVRGQTWDERASSANILAPCACAATWDEALIVRLGRVLAGEAQRKGVDVVLAPTLNLQRSPLAGRHYEYYSEDPLLCARMGLAFVHGLQAGGVAATAKHYVCNDSETNRFTVDVRVGERALRELYLFPFEVLVRDGHVRVVMAAYNSVNGRTMTEHTLLRDPLLTEWKFDGVVVSDWYAARSTVASAAAGLGLVMPGPEGPWGEALLAAVREGAVTQECVVDKARRVIRLAARVGKLNSTDASTTDPGTTSEDVPTLLRQAAASSFVLTENPTGALPLDWRTLRRLAVLGPNADVSITQGGGTSGVVPDYAVSPLAGLREALEGKVEVVHTPGSHDHSGLLPIPDHLISCPVCGRPGMNVAYEGPDGRELLREHRSTGELMIVGEQMLTGAVLQVAARFRPDVTGAWEIGVAGVGPFRLVAGDKVVVDDVLRPLRDNFGGSFLVPPQLAVRRTIAAGEEISLLLTHPLQASLDFEKIILGVLAPRLPDDEELANAVELARAADAAVVVVGTNPRLETEGLDRTSMALPQGQDDLVRAVAAVNPKTVVVVNCGAPVAMPWRRDVAAVLVAWFPGQELGHALADVLLGVVEPGGRLPMTWGANDEDVPLLSTRPVGGGLEYAEGLHVGYRAWLRAGAMPAYPFGYGLGYTAWRYTSLQTPTTARTGDDVPVLIRLRNIGARPGKEIVQLYLSRHESSLERPLLWLAGFTVVTADAEQEVSVEARVSARAFQHWSVEEHAWRTEPGLFLLTAGRSVEDRPLAAEIMISL